MIERVKHGGLQIASELDDLLKNEILDGLDIEPSDFWASFQAIFEEFLPRNNALIRKREDIQTKIDQWHIENRENSFDLEVYKDFLISCLKENFTHNTPMNMKNLTVAASAGLIASRDLKKNLKYNLDSLMINYIRPSEAEINYTVSK